MCISKSNEITILKRDLHSHILCVINHSSQDMGSTEASVDGCVDQENLLHLSSRMLVSFSFRKEEMLLFVTTWMTLEDRMLGETLRVQKDK